MKNFTRNKFRSYGVLHAGHPFCSPLRMLWWACFGAVKNPELPPGYFPL